MIPWNNSSLKWTHLILLSYIQNALIKILMTRKEYEYDIHMVCNVYMSASQNILIDMQSWQLL